MSWWKNRRQKQKAVFSSSALSALTGTADGNPGRGWYRIFPFVIGKTADLDALRWCLDKDDTLALVLLDIGGVGPRSLSEAELAEIRRIFTFFRENGQDMIVRIVYDREGNAVLREPTHVSQIQTHMRQFGPILRAFADAILVVQGLFFGSWGEMHSSAYEKPAYIRLLAKTLWEASQGSVTLAVRRPVQRRMLSTDGQEPPMRVALFDDAMFASSTHMGTFAGGGVQSDIWEQPWNMEKELAYEDTCVPRLPNGGEALWGENLSASETLKRLGSMHVCYLNKTYEEKRLEAWKQSPWQEGSVYDYIGRHLGYRFVIRRAKVMRTRAKSPEAAEYLVTIEVENTGFGNLCQAARLIFVLEGVGKKQRFETDADPRTWDSRKVTPVSGKVMLARQNEDADVRQETVLYAALERVCDGRPIRFANAQTDIGVCLGSFA